MECPDCQRKLEHDDDTGYFKCPIHGPKVHDLVYRYVSELKVTKICRNQFSWYGEIMEDLVNNYYNNDIFFRKFVDNLRYLSVSKTLGIYPVFTDVGREFGLVDRNNMKNVCGTKVKVEVKNMEKYGCHIYKFDEGDIWSVNNRVLLDISRYTEVDNFIIIIPEKNPKFIGCVDERGPGMIDFGKWILLVSPYILDNIESYPEKITEMKSMVSLDDVW